MTLKYGDLVGAQARIITQSGPVVTVRMITDDEVANVDVRMHVANTYGVNLEEPDLVSVQGNIELIQDDTAIIAISVNPMGPGGLVKSDPTHVALKLEHLKLLVPSIRPE